MNIQVLVITNLELWLPILSILGFIITTIGIIIKFQNKVIELRVNFQNNKENIEKEVKEIKNSHKEEIKELRSNMTSDLRELEAEIHRLNQQTSDVFERNFLRLDKRLVEIYEVLTKYQMETTKILSSLSQMVENNSEHIKNINNDNN